MVLVVVADCSIYGRKLKEYLAWSSSGPTHQAVASKVAPAQHSPRVISRRPRAWVKMYKAGRISASRVDVALTPPMHSTTTPDLAAARTGDSVPRQAATSGSTAHGASSPGMIPAEVDPITMVKVGQSANASPATSLDRSVPISSARASLIRPAKPTAMSTESQS